jgi:hypothetical protein
MFRRKNHNIQDNIRDTHYAVGIVAFRDFLRPKPDEISTGCL